MYAATGDAVVVLAEEDGHWRASATLEGSAVQCLAVAGEGVVFAGTRGDGVWRSVDGGRTWKVGGLAGHEVFSVAVSPADGAVYAGCEPSAIYRSRRGAGDWEELAGLHAVPSAAAWGFPP